MQLSGRSSESSATLPRAVGPDSKAIVNRWEFVALTSLLAATHEGHAAAARGERPQIWDIGVPGHNDCSTA